MQKTVYKNLNSMISLNHTYTMNTKNYNAHIIQTITCACACACADAYTDVCLHIPYKCLPEFQKEKWIIWWLHLIFYLFSSSLSRALINYKNQCPQFLTLLKQGKPQIFPTQATLNFNWGYAEIQSINECHRLCWIHSVKFS